MINLSPYIRPVSGSAPRARTGRLDTGQQQAAEIYRNDTFKAMANKVLSIAAESEANRAMSDVRVAFTELKGSYNKKLADNPDFIDLEGKAFVQDSDDYVKKNKLFESIQYRPARDAAKRYWSQNTAAYRQEAMAHALQKQLDRDMIATGRNIERQTTFTDDMEADLNNVQQRMDEVTNDIMKSRFPIEVKIEKLANARKQIAAAHVKYLALTSGKGESGYDKINEKMAELSREKIEREDLFSSDEIKKLKSDFIKEQEYNEFLAERKNDESIKGLIDNVRSQMAEGKSLGEVQNLIRQTVGITIDQKERLAEIAVKTSRIWQDTGRNPWTTTSAEGYDKLAQDMFDVQDGKIRSHKEMRERWLKNGVPAYGMNYFLMLDNNLENGGSTLELKYRSKLFEHFAKKGKIPSDKLDAFRDANEQLTEILKEGGDIDTKFESLISEVDNTNAKDTVSRWWRQSPLGVRAVGTPWAPATEKSERPRYAKTATNPETGERMGYDGEKWVLIQ